MEHRATVRGLPEWIDAPRLLGPARFAPSADGLHTTLDTERAADLAARLRGLHLDGVPIELQLSPPLKRTAVRAGRTRDARLRRDTTPGFTRDGTELDDEGRWSLTPESLALRMGEAATGRRVVDLGCGAGGNTIGFARAGCPVFAVEPDATRRRLAAHNAKRYGVANQVHFAASLPDNVATDLLFVDPPWGTDYSREGVTLADLPLLAHAVGLLQAGRAQELWTKLPPSFVSTSLPGATCEAVFGEAAGDYRRIKFLWLRLRRP